LDSGFPLIAAENSLFEYALTALGFGADRKL